MAVYHLHLINVHVDADDPEGQEFASLEAARATAIDGIRGFLSDEVRKGKLDLRGRIDIEDDAGAVVMTVAFDEAVSIKPS